jgi:dipeptidyl aminopeptidase/acylaminoacyl peptidase
MTGRNILLSLLAMAALLPVSCKNEGREKNDLVSPINVELTAEEIAVGRMTPEILWKFGRTGGGVLSPDGKTVLYTLTHYDLATEARTTNIYSIPVGGGDPVQLTTQGGSSPQWFSGGGRVAFVRQGKLWTMNPDGTDAREITGLSDFTSFSISPVGDMIFFTRRVKLDQTPAEKHGLPKANVRIINDLMYRHWDSWHDYSYSHLFTAYFDGVSVTGETDIMEGQRIESPTAPFYDAAEIAWSPDGRRIVYTSKQLYGKDDALSTNTDLFLYDINNYSLNNITRGNKGFDRHPVFSPDGTRIAYLSMEEDGYESDLERIFIYDINNNSGEYVSEGWDYNAESILWSSNDRLFFTSPYLGTTQIFTLDLASGEISQVTTGVHDLSLLALSGNTLIAGINSMSMAREIASVDALTGSVSLITDVNRHIYDHIKMGAVEERYIKTKDGMDLQMWIIYPPDFDPSQKYPALLYAKGGPQGPLGQGWSYRWNYQLMAANGYIIVAPNRRGNSGFGSEWREQISGDYGGKNIQDYLDAIDAMAKEPFVDETRLGAVGASYGGYSVFYLAGVHDGRFKALVSHCGMYNFESWYGSTEEYWFPNKDIGGPFWENPRPESYRFSPHLMVAKWTSPILIITGEHDYRIPYTQSLEAFNAAQLRGIPSRLLFFHDENHWVTKPQNSVIWQREFFGFLDEYLK